MDKVLFTCVDGDTTAFPHFWEHTVGSGHATLALTANWQRQMTRCSQELGFKHVRFHGILDDDMGTLNNQNDELIYSFFNADCICDFLLSIGMRPFVELSFMPLTLSSGPDIVFHYKGNVTPPRDYHAWEVLINKLVQHWANRYGMEEVKQWFFEVWNEPNLRAFWTGTQYDYFHLYECSARAIKNVHSELKVGGPATAGNEWITDFLDFCKKYNIAVDFVSTHHYPTDSFGMPGDDTIQQLSDSRRSVLQEQVAQVKQQAGTLPVYYTEWSTSSNPFDGLHDLPYAAAFITKTVMEAQGYVQGYSYWTFSDIFEENYFSSMPFHGGFGLMNVHGIPKPAYRAYQLMHHLGTERLAVQGKHETVDVWIFKKEGAVQILVVNSQLPKHAISLELVTIELKLKAHVASAYVEKIDDYHANATQAWIEMGSPATLSIEQVATLEHASELTKEDITVQINADTISVSIEMPPQGVACVTLVTE